MKLAALCEAIGAKTAVPELDITGISSDSRTVGAGMLYVCIRGLRVDGHSFAAGAVASGAAAVLAEEDAELPELGVPVIRTVNTRRAMAFLYDAWYGFPSKKLRIVAVTGTNGKTSVTYMLRSIFRAAGYRVGLIGTVNCTSDGRDVKLPNADKLANMTTPDPEELYHMLALMVEDKVDFLFMEATSHALALNKLDPLHFEAAVYTNLTPEHLDFHGSMENYFDAKASLFEKTELGLINVDCPYGSRMAASAREKNCRVLTCSAQGNAADFRAEDVRADGVDGIHYTLESKNAYFQVKCPIPGSFTVKNSLQAAAVAMLFGILPSTVQDALQTMHHVDGRIERVKLCPGAEFSVFIDYAHTPDALENLLNAAHGFRMPGQRIVLLFGCGGDRDKTKRPKMAEIACKLADAVIITSDNSRSEEPTEIIRDILAGVDPASDYVVIPDRAEAISYAIEYAKKGDIILLAGKGHETYEINRTGRHAFCEREIAEAAAEKFYGIGH